MDDLILAFARLPWFTRCCSVLVLGIVYAVAVNVATYYMAWNQRAIGPWLRAHPKAPSRRASDFLPVLGWWGLRRESAVHHAGFWIRPFLVELSVPVALLALYTWELHVAQQRIPAGGELLGHQWFLRHAILGWFMLVATLIDFDEKTIPDSITIPGTLLALVTAAIWPKAGLPVLVGPLVLSSPAEWPLTLDGPWGWMLGCVALWFWCLAMLMPRRIWWKSGLTKALRYLIAGVLRYPYWFWVALAGLVGTLGVHQIWRGNGLRWQALLSALSGMLFGIVLVWMVRIIASRALRKEALGFGDVTLMGMIGAYLGWQPTLLVFFVAPFVGVVIAVGQWVATRNPEIAYGPYLCLGAVVVVLRWPDFWDRWSLLFALGWWIPIILGICLVLMAILLTAWRLVRRFIGSGRPR